MALAQDDGAVSWYIDVSCSRHSSNDAVRQKLEIDEAVIGETQHISFLWKHNAFTQIILGITIA